MKVLQISKFYPPVMGGIESVAWELSEGLRRAGAEADVLCSNQCRATVRERYAADHEVVRAASFGMLLSTSIAPAMIGQLRRMARGCDVIHVHMPDPMAAFAMWAARPDAALVVHWHSDVIRQRLALLAYGPLQDWLLRRAHAVVATSQAYADSSLPLRRWRDKVAVIPIGISDYHAVASEERAARIRQSFRDRRIVFSLGRMTYYKGFDVLVAAAAALPDDCVVLIGGDGELLDPYRRVVAARGLVDKVHFLGHINDDELPNYFLASDVFCLCSTVRAEAYGVAMLEAMSMGKPIVAVDIVGSGVPWVNVNGSTGFNLPVGEAGPLAGALNRLLAEPALRQALGAAARERYLQHFNSELMTRRTLDLYQDVRAPAAASQLYTPRKI